MIIQEKEEITDEPTSPVKAGLNGPGRDWPLIGTPPMGRMGTYSTVKWGNTMVSGVVKRIDLVEIT